MHHLRILNIGTGEIGLGTALDLEVDLQVCPAEEFPALVGLLGHEAPFFRTGAVTDRQAIPVRLQATSIDHDFGTRYLDTGVFESIDDGPAIDLRLFDLRQADHTLELMIANTVDHTVQGRPVAEFFLTRNQMDLALIALQGGIRWKISEMRAVERGLHDDVVFVFHRIRANHCPQAPDERLGMLIDMQHAFVFHRPIMRVQFTKMGFVKANIIVVAPALQQRFFQQVRLTRALCTGNDEHFGLEHAVDVVALLVEQSVDDLSECEMEIGIGKRIERGHDGSFPWFANVTVTKVSAAASAKG